MDMDKAGGFPSVSGILAGALAAAAGLLPASAVAVIEEVVVTAQKREQSLRQVGLNVSAFTEDQIEALRIEIPNDIAHHVPNVDITSQLGTENQVVTIRGIGLNDFSANLSPSVGVYLDEVFLASPAMVRFAVFDIERVEVLKGPQGTLYGRNTTGGAINFITRQPGAEREGYVRGGYGNFDTFEGEGAFTLPLSDSASVRVAGIYHNQDDSFFTNTSRGELDGTETYAVRGILAARLAPSVDAVATLQYGSRDGTNILLNPIGVRGAACNSFDSGEADPANCVDRLGYSDATADPFEADIGDVPDPFVDAETFSVTGRITWNIDDHLQVISVTGYQDFDREIADHTDSNPFRLLTDIRADQIEQVSQELRLAGQYGPLDWIVGAFYSSDTVDSRNDFDFFDALGIQAFNLVDQDTESAAGFVDGRWALNDDFTIVGGARVTWEERQFIGQTSILNGPTVSSVDDSIDNVDLSGRIGLEYTPTDNSLYYVTFSKGFHSGGFFGSLAFNPLQYQAFDEETVFAYEGGVKWTLADGRVQLNASGFYYEYKDVQTTVGVAFGSALTNVDGTTEVLGLDLDVTVQPVEGLLLRGGLGLLDTELPAFVGPILGPIPEGNELPNAPDVSANGLARYEFPLSNTGYIGALQVDFHYSGEARREAQNLPLATADDYAVWNARASISSADDRWELAVWGKNLSDNEYEQFVVFIAFSQAAYQSFAPPRTFGATLSYRF
jgi:iron complex outermembrane receptor protein